MKENSIFVGKSQDFSYVFSINMYMPYYILWLWKVSIHYDEKNAMDYEIQSLQDNKTLVLSSLSPNHKLMSYT